MQDGLQEENKKNYKILNDLFVFLTHFHPRDGGKCSLRHNCRSNQFDKIAQTVELSFLLPKTDCNWIQ